MSNLKKLEILLWTVFAVYLILLLKLAVFRHDFLEWPLFSNGRFNAIPFSFYYRLLLDHRHLYFIYLFGGNIAWFIPFGFLLPMLTGRPKKLLLMILCGIGFSFIIEFAQFAFGTGESELDDLMLNTLGVAAGYLLLKAYIKRLFGCGRKKVSKPL